MLSMPFAVKMQRLRDVSTSQLRYNATRFLHGRVVTDTAGVPRGGQVSGLQPPIESSEFFRLARLHKNTAQALLLL